MCAVNNELFQKTYYRNDLRLQRNQTGLDWRRLAHQMKSRREGEVTLGVVHLDGTAAVGFENTLVEEGCVTKYFG